MILQKQPPVPPVAPKSHGNGQMLLNFKELKIIDLTVNTKPSPRTENQYDRHHEKVPHNRIIKYLLWNVRARNNFT